MGYPMTWRRFINRNGLAEGDYGNVPHRHSTQINLDTPGLSNPDKPQEERTRLLQADLAPHYVERLRAYQSAYSNLLGDLRRLETDMVDESTICQGISQRTSIDVDTVAAVLKEFIAQ